MSADGAFSDSQLDDHGLNLRTGPDPGSTEGGEDEIKKDYFFVEGGERYAGKHILIDIRGGKRLDDRDFIERALRDCVEATGATLLHIHLHHFTPYGGVSGVAVLAESHISFHSWPEENFAALDVFMCGDTQPEKAIEILRSAFEPRRMDVQTVKRGRLESGFDGIKTRL